MESVSFKDFRFPTTTGLRARGTSASTWLANLLQGGPFEANLLAHAFFQKLNEHPLARVEDIEQFLEEYARVEETSEEQFMVLVVGLYSAFCRENVTGPSIFSVYAEDTHAPVDSSAPLKETVLDKLTTKNTAL